MYRENVEGRIKLKQEGQKITTVEQPRKTPVIDLMEPLKQSLDAERQGGPPQNLPVRRSRRPT
jgi:non-homologous end joining protein Ku